MRSLWANPDKTVATARSSVLARVLYDKHLLQCCEGASPTARCTDPRNPHGLSDARFTTSFRSGLGEAQLLLSLPMRQRGSQFSDTSIANCSKRESERLDRPQLLQMNDSSVCHVRR
jgi:hypothetical protein